MPRADGQHVVLDMATTTVAAGKVRVAYMKGEPVPDHSLVDRNGVETTDASVIFSKDGGGAMQPPASQLPRAPNVWIGILAPM